MDTDNDVARLHDKLTDAMRQTRRRPGAPVTVAEIYQELVPYRLVRSEVGFGMNADYEHVLLRLLAGEGEFARLEPVSARDAIRDELRGPNPNVGMYREFAGCDVWVRTDDVMADILDDDDEDVDDHDDDEAAGSWQGLEALGADIDDDAADVITGVATFAIVEDDDDIEGDAVDAHDVADGADAANGARATSHAAVRSTCAYCDSSLPAHRPVRFCPYCGADQTTQPCVACGESLEPGWTYCILCGTSRGDAAG